jgi:hypothetical protein
MDLPLMALSTTDLNLKLTVILNSRHEIYRWRRYSTNLNLLLTALLNRHEIYRRRRYSTTGMNLLLTAPINTTGIILFLTALLYKTIQQQTLAYMPTEITS